MSIAALLLTVDSPLGDYVLAGQSGCDLLRDVAQKVAAYIHETTPSQDLAPLYQEWLELGVESVLLLPSNRPLVTTHLLSALRAAPKAPLVVARDHGGRAAVARAEFRWLISRLPVAIPDVDLDAIAVGTPASHVTAEDPAECMAIVDLAALAEAERAIRQRINLRLMRAGVRMIDPTSTYIDAQVTIGPGTTLLPNSHLWGRTSVGENCRIGPNAILRDSHIGNCCVVTASMVEEAVMEDHSDVGPFSHLRKGARMCQGAHMGNYGEIKNSTLGPGSKMGHFSYLGDATVGRDVNIGAGTITCNYDGERKHKTVIHDGAFIGSDTMLVAPLEIGAGARIGAGSVVTRDVPAGAIAYGVPARIKRMIEEGESDGPGK
jgi:bifunctional UDP-N-acetylglucosamine pyrophosphorylase/glucosamine-1-phosphate N-acetyltransferase